MRVSAINNTNFKQVVETHRKDSDKEEDDSNIDVYETTITWTETVKVPKSDKTLQKIDYVV